MTTYQNKFWEISLPVPIRKMKMKTKKETNPRIAQVIFDSQTRSYNYKSIQHKRKYSDFFFLKQILQAKFVLRVTVLIERDN